MCALLPPETETLEDNICQRYLFRAGGRNYPGEALPQVPKEVVSVKYLMKCTTSANLLKVAKEQGDTLMYAIDPVLSPGLPDQARRQDAIYNMDKDVTILCHHHISTICSHNAKLTVHGPVSCSGSL